MFLIRQGNLEAPTASAKTFLAETYTIIITIVVHFFFAEDDSVASDGQCTVRRRLAYLNAWNPAKVTELVASDMIMLCVETRS